jgi:hypothetical protein
MFDKPANHQPPIWGKIFREKTNGVWQYWAYTNGDRVMLSVDWVYEQYWKGAVVLIDAEESLPITA